MYLLPSLAVWLFAAAMVLRVSVRGQGSLDPGVDVENPPTALFWNSTSKPMARRAGVITSLAVVHSTPWPTNSLADYEAAPTPLARVG
jgi:hypothetical protein